MYNFKIETNALSEDFMYNKLGLNKNKSAFDVFIKCYKHDCLKFMLHFICYCNYCYKKRTKLTEIQIIHTNIDIYKEIYDILVEYKNILLIEIENSFKSNMLKNFYREFYTEVNKIIQKIVYKEKESKINSTVLDDCQFKIETNALSNEFMYKNLKLNNCNVIVDVYIKCYKQDCSEFMLHFSCLYNYCFNKEGSLICMELLDSNININTYKDVYNTLVEYKDKLLIEIQNSFKSNILKNFYNEFYKRVTATIQELIFN